MIKKNLSQNKNSTYKKNEKIKNEIEKFAKRTYR